MLGQGALKLAVLSYFNCGYAVFPNKIFRLEPPCISEVLQTSVIMRTTPRLFKMNDPAPTNVIPN